MRLPLQRALRIEDADPALAQGLLPQCTGRRDAPIVADDQVLDDVAAVLVWKLRSPLDLEVAGIEACDPLVLQQLVDPTSDDDVTAIRGHDRPQLAVLRGVENPLIDGSTFSGVDADPLLERFSMLRAHDDDQPTVGHRNVVERHSPRIVERTHGPQLTFVAIPRHEERLLAEPALVCTADGEEGVRVVCECMKRIAVRSPEVDRLRPQGGGLRAAASIAAIGIGVVSVVALLGPRQDAVAAAVPGARRRARSCRTVAVAEIAGFVGLHDPIATVGMRERLPRETRDEGSKRGADDRELTHCAVSTVVGLRAFTPVPSELGGP